MPARAKARKKAPDPKQAILEAALAHVPADGFTDKMLSRAAKDAGVAEAEARRLYPKGHLSLVEAFSDWADREMEERLASRDLAKIKIRERIRTAVLARLDVLRPRKEAARRAAAFLTLPPHAGLALTLLYRTADAMWRAVGDRATDFNFYTKRMILAGVWTATLMRWFTDRSEDEAATAAFLDARIDDVMRFEKLKADVKARAEKLPSFADVLSGFSARKS